MERIKTWLYKPAKGLGMSRIILFLLSGMALYSVALVAPSPYNYILLIPGFTIAFSVGAFLLIDGILREIRENKRSDDRIARKEN